MRLVSEDQTAPAFVLGLGPNGYGQARSLVRAGIHTLGFYYSNEHFGRTSRFIRTLPVSRRTSAQALAELLNETAEGFPQRPVLFPASDEFAFLVAQGREHLAERFAFHWNAAEVVPKLFDKAQMIRFCENAAIPCPRTYVTTISEEIPKGAEAFTFPCLIKPRRSFRTAFPRGRKNYVAATPSDLLRLFEQYPYLIGATIWQEIIEGADDEIYQCNVLIGKSGEVRGVCVVRKLRQYPSGFGNMCFGRTEMNEIVASLSLKLLRLLNYRGFASVEFKRRASDDRYYFIELNARLPRYSVLLADAGVNLPYLGYTDLAAKDGCHDSPRIQNDNVYWLTAGEDIRSLRQSNGMRPSTLLSWIQSISRARSFAWWDRRDPMPFLRSALNDHAPTNSLGVPESVSISSEFNGAESREFFERQYESPQRVEAGRDSFLIFDIRPMQSKSELPILFCPGWMENPENHKETIYALYRLGRRTIFPDSPHGIEPKERTLYPEAELRKAAVLIETLRLLKISEVDAIAHSEGAINLAIAATAETKSPFRNVVFHSPAGMCDAASLLRGAWRGFQEALHENIRQKTRLTERQLLRDAQRRRMYLWKTLRQTLLEACAIVRADIRGMLVTMRRQGTAIAVIHAVDDRLFRMNKMQRNLDATMVDGFYSVEGGHQQLLVEPSRHGHLAGVVLLRLALRQKQS
jgi:predicted ATP-grasp superfamily ATP-dependent carboligase